MEITPGIYIDLGSALSQGPRSAFSDRDVALIRSVVSLYLNSLANQRAPLNSEPTHIVFLDPSALEQEMLEEEAEVGERLKRKDPSASLLKTSVVSIRLIFAEPYSKASTLLLSDQNKESKDVKESTSFVKGSSSTSLKEAFQSLKVQYPELSSQINEISQCFEEQNTINEKKGLVSKQDFSKLNMTSVKLSLGDLGTKELLFLAKDLVKDHPVLAFRLVKEFSKECSSEELMNLVDSLKQEHPLLALEVAKGMKEEVKSTVLKQLAEGFIKENPEASLAAAKAMKGQDGFKQLEKLVFLLKENNPSLALESAKAIFGKDSGKALFGLALQFAKEHPDLALESAKAIRGKERLEQMGALVKQLYKEHPELALKLAHVVLEQVRMIPSSEIRNQLLALLTPPLEIKEIKFGANPFAQSFSFRASGVSASKAKKKKPEEEEEESAGPALFTFYIRSLFEKDFIQKVEKALLLEGVQTKIVEMKDYEKLIEQLKEEKLGSLFFQQKILVKPPFAPLVSLYIEPLGLYSEKVRSLQDLTEKSIIAIPKEQRERSLLFLEKIGFYKKATLQEIETPFLISSLESCDAILLPSLEAWRFGLLPQALILENRNSPYVTVLAVPSKELEDTEFLFLKKCLESEEMRSYMQIEYQGVVIPAF